jgi:hypothetical protein
VHEVSPYTRYLVLYYIDGWWSPADNPFHASIGKAEREAARYRVRTQIIALRDVLELAFQQEETHGTS